MHHPINRLARFAGKLGLCLGLAWIAQGVPLGLWPLHDGLPGSPWFWGSFLTCMNSMEDWAGREIPDWVVHSQVLDYTARMPRYDALGHLLTGPDGEPLNDQVRLSGRVFFPPAWRARGQKPLPVVVYNHGTSLRKDAVPSAFRGHEWAFGAAAAAFYGLAVVMPDYPGMGGDSWRYHPFCHRRTLAYAVVDALPAVRRMVQEDPYLIENGYRWDNRLYFMGYSEGGYASLAAAREWEGLTERYRRASGFDLSGTACMGAPLDLTGATREAFLHPTTPTPHVFYLPMIVLGYREVYGRLVDPEEILAPALLENREDGGLLQWADGSREGLLVDAAIGRRLGLPPGGLVLRGLFNPAWVTGVLEAEDFLASPLGQAMRENDLVDGWAPTRPILFAHSPDDHDISIQKAYRALGGLSRAVEQAGGDPASLLELRLLAQPGEGVDHVAGLFIGITTALRWIEEQRGKPKLGAATDSLPPQPANAVCLASSSQ
jgi:hypothetical protein